MSDYGEPWKERPDRFSGLQASGGIPLDLARAVACVNALAGRNPSKLAELENEIETVLSSDDGHGYHALRAALAAFRGETP